ncbi:MAG: peptidoglycan-binding protein [Propionibacteriaceae bacterium]|jgi:hypothetical protein|nr:peptidoglycan-binding protein [Propionibacteriaceae bacterium]
MSARRSVEPVVRRQRVLLVVLTVALLVCGAGLVAVWNIKSPAQQAAEQSPPPPSVLTAAVKEEVLVEQVVLRALVRADSVTLRSRMSGAVSLVTALPQPASGQVIEGSVLVEISGRPVFALSGAVPAYRPLVPDLVGADVSQLQAALQRLGLLTGKFKDGTFDKPTANAVTKLYQNHGYSPSCDGATVAVCLGEVVFVPSLPALVAGVAVKVGDDAPSGTELLTLQLGQAFVSAVAPQGMATGLAAGLAVSISDDASQRQCEGVLASIGDYAPASSDGGQAAGHPISVTAADCVDSSWLGLNVRLVIALRSTDGPVLVAPTSAIQTAVDGSTYVTVTDPAVGERRVDVETGLIAGGEVAVYPLDGQALTAGDLVVTG